MFRLGAVFANLLGAEHVADASGSPSNVQAQEARNDKYDDYDAYDVENIHCVLRFRFMRLQYEATTPSLKQT